MCVGGGDKHVFHKHQHNTPRRGRKEGRTELNPHTHNAVRDTTSGAGFGLKNSHDRPVKTPKPLAHGEKTCPTGTTTPQKAKVGQGLGAFASRGLAAASAPSEATHSRTRTSHTARSRLLLRFKFLTGSERFHGRGLSLRLCPGLAAPYRR